jgi:hypothetical protein
MLMMKDSGMAEVAAKDCLWKGLKPESRRNAVTYLDTRFLNLANDPNKFEKIGL